MSFADVRCSEKLFEVNTKLGTSSSEMSGHGDITDEVAIPPPDPYFVPFITKKQILPHCELHRGYRKKKTVPSTGFELNLVIKYDNDFLAEYPSPEST